MSPRLVVGSFTEDYQFFFLGMVISLNFSSKTCTVCNGVFSVTFRIPPMFSLLYQMFRIFCGTWGDSGTKVITSWVVFDIKRTISSDEPVEWNYGGGPVPLVVGRRRKPKVVVMTGRVSFSSIQLWASLVGPTDTDHRTRSWQ